MALHTEVTPSEAADRLAIRELFDAYAHCADRRDANGQLALFIEDAVFAVFDEFRKLVFARCHGQSLVPVSRPLEPPICSTEALAPRTRVQRSRR